MVNQIRPRIWKAMLPSSPHSKLIDAARVVTLCRRLLLIGSANTTSCTFLLAVKSLNSLSLGCFGFLKLFHSSRLLRTGLAWHTFPSSLNDHLAELTKAGVDVVALFPRVISLDDYII